MALVVEADFQGDQGQRLAAPPHQGFCPLDSPLHDKALRAETDRLFERAAEMVEAQTRDPGEIRQAQPILQMRFNLVAHTLRSFARQSIRERRREFRRIDEVPHHPHRERRVQSIDKNVVEKITLRFLNQGRHDL